VWADFRKPRSYRKALASLLRRFTGDMMRAQVPDWHQLGTGPVNQPWKWTPKAVRLGLEYGLLQENEGIIQFSSSYVTHLCEEARKLLTSRSTSFAEEGWLHLHVAAAGKAKTVKAFLDDFTYFVSEASGVPLVTYMMGVGSAAGVLTGSHDGNFIPSSELIDEFFEIAERPLSEGTIQNDEEADLFVVQALCDLANARLLIGLPEKKNHAHLLGLFLHKVFGFGGIVKRVLAELSGDSGEQAARQLKSQHARHGRSKTS
jgi:hypothetical protein